MSIMPMPNPAAGATGKVINITEGQGPNPQGQWTKGRNVTYQLASGHTGTVFVPADQFNPDTVTAAIQADAANLAAALNITF